MLAKLCGQYHAICAPSSAMSLTVLFFVSYTVMVLLQRMKMESVFPQSVFVLAGCSRPSETSSRMPTVSQSTSSVTSLVLRLCHCQKQLTIIDWFRLRILALTDKSKLDLVQLLALDLGEI
jgi:hypothetical protein